MNDHIQACGDTELAYHQTQVQAEVVRAVRSLRWVTGAGHTTAPGSTQGPPAPFSPAV
ncbi:hypothetical protein ORG27_13345 [Stenotrophomonas lactitubi]|jgi:hypothetical protein|uniref:hypothetical protein n=1 Tax=Stenotrophomonas lactitubi TaxID=2045214 RepID=UPI00224902E7|nr:hypothetical protein [Stenotrophomonas lactitubi]MCX2894566.1 hypothetical protein [Stenotrophomonas lactitubi]